MSRKEKEIKQRKDYILQAATELFAEKGYDNTTMDEVSLKAEFSKGTLYQYFESKQEIYATICEEMISELFSIFSEILNNDMLPLEKLKTIIKTSFEYAYDNKHLSKILLTREVDITLYKDKFFFKIEEKTNKRFVGFISAAISAKQLKGDAKVLNILLEGMFNNALAYLINNDYPKDEYLKFADTIVSLITSQQ